MTSCGITHFSMTNWFFLLGLVFGFLLLWVVQETHMYLFNLKLFKIINLRDCFFYSSKLVGGDGTIVFCRMELISYPAGHCRT